MYFLPRCCPPDLMAWSLADAAWYAPNLPTKIIPTY